MANTYLQRTFGSGNQQIWTWSGWIKRNKLGTDQQIFGRQLDGSNIGSIRFQSDDAIRVNNNTSGTGVELYTTMKFRDTNGWYHLVVVFKGSESTASDRVDIYVNGEEIDFTVTSSTTAGNGYINGSGDHFIGKRAPGDNDRFLEAVLSHVHFIDGTAYTPSTFGETDANGVWKIKTDVSVTYGNNGFFILKDGNSVTDQSGNSNNFTVGGGTLTNTEDSPSNVFATLNPLYLNSGTGFSEGNLTFTKSTTSWSSALSTLGTNTGKFFTEIKYTSSGFVWMGVCSSTQAEEYSGTWLGSAPVTNSTGIALGMHNGEVYSNDAAIFTGSVVSVGSIIGIALDLDNGYIYFSIDGVWINSGDPTSGSSGTGGFSLQNRVNSEEYFFGASTYNNSQIKTNFGNGYFGTTAVASAGTNASGNGIFEYDVPTGYTALCTKGLNGE